MAQPLASPLHPNGDATTSLSAAPGEVTWTEAQDKTYGAFGLLSAWVLLIILLAILNATQLGKIVLYYLALLTLTLLLVTQSQAIGNIFAPLVGTATINVGGKQ